MKQQTTLFLVLALLIGGSAVAAGGISIWLGGTSDSHQAILDKTVVTAKISNDVPYAALEPTLIERSTQKIQALDIIDVAKKAKWIGKNLDCSTWKWTFEGETLMFMRVWGPNTDNECLVEFSKITMTDVWVDVAGTKHHFPLATMQTEGADGYWWLYAEVK